MPLITTGLEQWFRAGRGHGIEFYATDEEVQGLLLSALPATFAPYRLVGADSLQEGRVYVEHPFSCEVGEFLQYRHTDGALRTQFWLLSTILTLDLPLVPGSWLTAMYSLNGLISIQHGWMRRDPVHHSRPLGKSESSLGLVDKVYNVSSGEMRDHQAYLSLFNVVKRAMRKLLIYTNVPIGPDDIEGEPSSSPMWTEGAKREYEAGMPFFRARPGPSLLEVRESKKRQAKR